MAALPTDPLPATPVKKTKRNYIIFDDKALYTTYPQFFKLVPDYAKINAAIKLGIPMPGIKSNAVEDGVDYDEEFTDGEDDAQS